MTNVSNMSSNVSFSHPADSEVSQVNEQEELVNLRGSRSRLSRYVDVQIDGNTLYAFHSQGCQLISFEGEERPPRQAEILMALQNLGVNMRGIRGLQNTGKNDYTLYPVDKEIKLLNFDTFDVLGRKAKVLEAPPFTLQIGPRTVDIHITELPLDVEEDELLNKIFTRFNVRASACK
ncbi:hypothetical protein ACJMK2_021406 [Sinanodonta woodiana]|uniref:Uncharacterized protein n=1 Tax=Sinanodonta woodiana TaxID=1069815 RepID=A0ABD3TGP3_SINWO